VNSETIKQIEKLFETESVQNEHQRFVLMAILENHLTFDFSLKEFEKIDASLLFLSLDICDILSKKFDLLFIMSMSKNGKVQKRLFLRRSKTSLQILKETLNANDDFNYGLLQGLNASLFASLETFIDKINFHVLNSLFFS
jgi:hypothetical protein